MSKIWSFILIISIIYAVFLGNSQIVINSIMENGKIAVENILSLIGMMCFWNGIFNIFEKTSIINKLSLKFNKILKFFLNTSKMNEKTKQFISLNILSNIIGIGNAATINGIKAIKSMHEENGNSQIPSNNMTTFVLLNTASLQLIPTSMIALRALYGSNNPSSIIIPIWIVTFISLMFGIISIKILNKKI